MDSEFYKPEQSNFIRTFDDFFGYDIAGLLINDEGYYGYFDISPIEARLIKNFNYLPDNEEFNKPFRAHWLISDSKLLLCYVNGVINGLKLNSTEIVPEYPNEDLFHFQEFSGMLKFSVKNRDKQVATNGIIGDFEIVMLSIEKGIITKMEFQYKHLYMN